MLCQLTFMAHNPLWVVLVLVLVNLMASTCISCNCEISLVSLVQTFGRRFWPHFFLWVAGKKGMQFVPISLFVYANYFALFSQHKTCVLHVFDPQWRSIPQCKTGLKVNLWAPPQILFLRQTFDCTEPNIPQAVCLW